MISKLKKVKNKAKKLKGQESYHMVNQKNKPKKMRAKKNIKMTTGAKSDHQVKE